MQHDTCPGSFFFLSVTELRKNEEFQYLQSPPCSPPVPKTFLQIRVRVQDGYGLLSTTSQARSVCPGANASPLANIFTLTLSLVYLFVLLSLGVFNTVFEGSTKKKK